MLTASSTNAQTQSEESARIPVLSPSAQSIPLFTTMSREECEAVLARNNVGRIAFAVHDRVNIVPIHYVYMDGWIYGRTTSATKLRLILRNRRIAFEVDEHSELFEWRSVVVHGPLYVVQPDTTQHSRSVYRTAISLIRRLIAESLTDSDPVPFRDQLFRIRAIEVTGKASSPYGGKRLFPDNGRAITETAKPEDDEVLLESVRAAIESVGVAETSDVHVDAFDGVVVLSGTVETGRDRQAIEAEVLLIPAVVAVVQEIETRFPIKQEAMPSELAHEVLKELRAGPDRSTNAIKVVIEHGWLRLEGEVISPRDRDDAIRRLRGIAGSRGVIDRTRIVAKES